MMEFLQEILSTLFIIAGVVFMMIAALGILRLPDFYIRMSAITKAGTMGVGLIVVGIAIYFNELIISAKAFVIISFMLLTAPVAAHIIARAAYRQGVPFWGRNLVDEMGEILNKLSRSREVAINDPSDIKSRFELIDYLTSLPPMLGGNMDKAMAVADEIKAIDFAEGHLASGMVHLRSRDYSKAEKDYKSAVGLSEGNVSYRYELGRFYLAVEWFEKAFAVFEDIFDDNNSEYMALLETGKVSAISGLMTEKGEDAIKRFITSNSDAGNKDMSEAFLYLGKIFSGRGDFKKASDNYERSLEFDPENGEAAYSLKQIKELSAGCSAFTVRRFDYSPF